MEKNTASVTISNEPLEHPALDFNFLRQEGIRHIQRLAGATWTDYNTHDPGVTILDLLCYAITDLGYRINYDIKDLLAEKEGSAYDSLYSPSKILTVNPVTVLDLRKIVLDVEGVKNGWVEKQTQAKPDIYFNPHDKTLTLSKETESVEMRALSGLYRVLIEQKEDTQTDAQTLETEVKKRLQACRGLCEDFAEIKVLVPQPITMAGQIEVGQVTDVDKLAADVLFAVACFISPPIAFHSLDSLLKKGKRIDEIFEGPVLSRGFIEDDDLLRASRKTELHTSDIIREIMDVPGVLAVNSIQLWPDDRANAEEWLLPLDTEKTPALKIRWNNDTIASDLTFTRNGFALRIDPVKLTRYYRELMQANNHQPLDVKERDLTPPPTSYRHIDNYYSVQNHFQQVYGVGQTGLPGSAPPKRMAQAKQLKAYLFFFEQVLADYFKQTAHAKDLFSFYNNNGTYFRQSLRHALPGAEEIMTPPMEAEAGATEETAAGSGDDLPGRKNRFLDHLLARFSENFTEYSLLLFDQLTQTTTLKQVFLQNYPAVSNERGKAFNYTLPGWNTDNISGLEKRVAAKLGITNFTRRSLSGDGSEGFHLLEHILLRPVPEDYASFSRYLIPKEITGFDAVERKAVRCYSEKHGLQTGNNIQITGSAGYDGRYTVDQVLPDSFQLAIPYKGAGTTIVEGDRQIALRPTWTRTDLNTKILIFTKPVISFAASNTPGRTRCESPRHNLAEGELIEIVGTTIYNGIGKVVAVTSPDSFEVDKPYADAATESGGRWIRANQATDPYSLQLTFVFPAQRQRFATDAFKTFAETIVREETPVHLTPYIRWLDDNELQAFEASFQTLLTQLFVNG